MKKAFYMMAAAAIALSSCSSEETTDVAKSSAITFRPTVGLNSRGVEMTTNDLNEMWVTGFYQKADEVYFSDLKFTKEKGTQGTFIPSAPVFWQDGRTYKFVAISPAKSEWPTGLTITREAVTCENFEPKADISAQKDMIIKAVDANNDQWGKELELNFKHILSQIQIKVKNGNENLVYNIKAVRINSVVGKKKLNYSTTTNTSTWGNIEGVNSDAQYTLTYANPYKLDGKNTTELTLTSADATVENGGGAMLIPQNVTAWNGAKVDDTNQYDGGTYISIYLNVRMASGNKFMYPAGAQGEQAYGWVAIPVPNINWEEGNKYIYTLDMSTGCGKVDPVDPGENVNPDGKDPSKPKDPAKGDNVFGKAIKFIVKVLEWTDKIAGTDNGKIEM